ncbi:MAG: hypothetical protein MI923_19460 [Phycisphaerales bacterium]|nr:hypothetical protein [Phycisphaerales bacterium]
MNRTFGIIVSLVWILSMAALIQRDVLPFWRAQDPPSQPIPPGEFQVAIHDEAGNRLGTTWLESMPLSTTTTVHSMTRLDVGAVTRILPMFREMFLDTKLNYDQDETLYEFSFRLETGSVAATVEAVRYEQEYACKAQIGNISKSMSFSGEMSKYLGDSLRPFTHLKGLHVGQNWRLRLLDPIALLKSQTLEFTTQLVEVTEREVIEHLGERVDCYKIKTHGTVAWADESGRVLRQEVQIPFLGKWILTDEPYDEKDRARAWQRMGSLRDGRLSRQSKRSPNVSDIDRHGRDS